MRNFLICLIAILFVRCSESAPREQRLEPENDAVSPLKSLDFLKRFGYLETVGDGDGPAESLYTDVSIRDALREVQKFGNIPQTGRLDNRTIELMNSKRCGMPDVYRESKPEEFQEDRSIGSKGIEHHKPHHHRHRHRHKRYVIGSPGWNKRHLTYYLGNWTPKLNREEVHRELKEAMDTWGRYGRLKFSEANDPANADIVVGFYRESHGDRYPFDGKGKILAHAFFPSQWGSYGGDVHFDDDEPWKINPDPFEDSVDFGMVALHELGHSLGLSHSHEDDSVMNPYYKSSGDKMRLGQDDIMAMYSLYIDRTISDEDPTTTPKPYTRPTQQTTEYYTRKPTTRQPQTTRPPTKEPLITTRKPTTKFTTPSTRGTTKDLITKHTTTSPRTSTKEDYSTTSTRRPEISTFWTPTKAPYTWRPPNWPHVVPVTPSSEDRVVIYTGDDESVETHKGHDDRHGIPPIQPPPQPGCLGSFDSAGYIRGEIFITFNQTLWRLSKPGHVTKGYPVDLKRFFHKLPEDVKRFDAMYERETDSSIVIFSGNSYWVFNGSDFIDGSPRPLSDYGLPEYVEFIDAAFVWRRNRKTYLFSGHLFWRYNETSKEVDPGYPRTITEHWKIPSPIDAALTDADGTTYFFRGDNYWAFDNKKVRPQVGYPKRASTFWIRCHQEIYRYKTD